MVTGSVQNSLRGMRAVQVLLTIAILWASWGLVRPLRSAADEDPVSPMRVQPAAATRPASSSQALEAYAAIWQRNWKQPLVDPPPPPVPKVEAPKPPPALRVKLVGTMIENGTAYGVFLDESKQLKIKAVHETIDGFRIAGIERGKAQLVQGERKVWLEVPNAGRP